MLKGVLLAWLLCGKREIFSSVIGLLGCVGLGAIGEKGEKKQINTRQTYAT